MGFEDELRGAAGRDEMHRFIDALPDGASVLILAHIPSDNFVLRVKGFGGLSEADALFMIRAYEHRIFRDITNGK